MSESLRTLDGGIGDRTLHRPYPLATSGTRPTSLLTLDLIFDGLSESAAVTTVAITGLTVGVAVVGRALGLRVDIEYK